MGLLVVNKSEKKEIMEPSHRAQVQACPSKRTERKVIEKNRRNRMKCLCATLNSLLPEDISKEPKSVPEQIDEAANYIKYLQNKIEEAKKKKECLLVRHGKRLCPWTGTSSTSNNNNSYESCKLRQIEVSVKGSILDVNLVSSSEDQSLFSDIIRLIHENGGETLNASYSVVGNSIYHLIHAQTVGHVGAETIAERLKMFINGSASTEDIANNQSSLPVPPEYTWDDLEIYHDLWNFHTA